MYNTVLFDLDGTLLDTLNDLAAAANHALSAMGLPLHEISSYRKMVGNGIHNLIVRMLPAQSRNEATIELATVLFSQYYQEHMLDQTQPYPGMETLLSRLKASGVRLGVVSNKADLYVRPIVEHYFPAVFEAAVGMRDGFAPKPAPDSVRAVMAKLDATAPGTLFVGDSDVDMLTAVGAGLACCGVLWGFRDEDELRAAGASYIASGPAQLQGIVLGKSECPHSVGCEAS